jgi:uncharacterized protein YndB with AHSA1/START domain
VRKERYFKRYNTDMPYATTIQVDFACEPAKVYRALCDLSTHPLWNSGMQSISETGMMHEGMRYVAESVVAGHSTRAEIEVVQLVPDREIELVNKAGAIAFRVLLQLHEIGRRQTRLECHLELKFQNFVLHLARPAIESMAQARFRGDLEMLRAMIEQ